MTSNTSWQATGKTCILIGTQRGAGHDRNKLFCLDNRSQNLIKNINLKFRISEKIQNFYKLKILNQVFFWRIWILVVNLWRAVLDSTLSHVLPHQHTDQRAQQRPSLLSAFPHHARTGIKGRPESLERAVRPGQRAGLHRSVAVALDGRPGDAFPGGYSHRKVSQAPSDFLVEPDRAPTNGCSHGRLSTWAGNQLQVPLTGPGPDIPGEDVIPRLGDLTFWRELEPCLTHTRPAHFNANLTRTWPELYACLTD